MHSAPLTKRNDPANHLGCSKVGTVFLVMASHAGKLLYVPTFRTQEDETRGGVWELSIFTVLSGGCFPSGRLITKGTGTLHRQRCVLMHPSEEPREIIILEKKLSLLAVARAALNRL